MQKQTDSKEPKKQIYCGICRKTNRKIHIINKKFYCDDCLLTFTWKMDDETEYKPVLP